jgi:hypothetical protein
MNHAADPGTLVLPPEPGFEALCARLAAAGWRLDAAARQPLVPGEPEHARFVRDSETLHYGFDPVCRLRQLDGRQAAAGWSDGLDGVDADAVRAWLAADDERSVLRGLLAAALLRDASLADAVAAQRAHPRAALRQAAARAAAVLAPTPSADEPAHEPAHEAALAAVEVLRAALAPLLTAVAQDPAGPLAQSLQPRDADWALAFVPDAATAARAAYAAAWPEAPRVRRAPADARLQMALCPAALLGGTHALARDFPSGYAQVQTLLQPQRVWAAWKLVPPGQTAGMAYDGLVWLDDHWAWFPKPWRVLAPLRAP